MTISRLEFDILTERVARLEQSQETTQIKILEQHVELMKQFRDFRRDMADRIDRGFDSITEIIRQIQRNNGAGA